MTTDLTTLAAALRASPFLGQSGSAADPWADAHAALSAMRTLGADWNGIGVPAPAPLLVDHAFRLAGWLEGRCLGPPARIVAGVTGSVIFKWQACGGAGLEVEVVAPFAGELTVF